jgi:hypothetical protein
MTPRRELEPDADGVERSNGHGNDLGRRRGRLRRDGKRRLARLLLARATVVRGSLVVACHVLGPLAARQAVGGGPFPSDTRDGCADAAGQHHQQDRRDCLPDYFFTFPFEP